MIQGKSVLLLPNSPYLFISADINSAVDNRKEIGKRGLKQLTLLLTRFLIEFW